MIKFICCNEKQFKFIPQEKEVAKMITVDNFKSVLQSMDFVQSQNIYEKAFPQFSCVLRVDFTQKKLIFPEAIKGRERNDSFDNAENFVVFECVNRLLVKGYRPEHIELEKEWHLGHDAKGGRADICVNAPDGSMLFIIECKTAGREFDKAYKDTLSDGGQLFSYWQQEQATKWLVLYTSDITESGIIHKAPTINCTDDPNIIALAQKDQSIFLYTMAHTASEKFNAWKETYGTQIHEDLVFSKDSRAYDIGIRPLYKKDLQDFTPEDKVVNRFEEILRHNNVSDKENAFNRLVALFICKLVDESTKGENDVVEFQYKQGTDTYETLQDRLQRLHQEGMGKFMREEIFYVPANYPEWLFTTYTGRQREKAIEDLKEKIRILKFYSNNDFSFKDVHNEELFYQNGKILVEVVQLFEKYRIVYPSKHQFLGDLFEQLLNKGFKQNEGQFFTPMPITRFIWDCLPLETITHSEKGAIYPKVIDYACGAGHFLTEAVEAINAAIGSNQNNSWVRNSIYGIEKDYRLARVSKISLFMNGAGEGNIIFGDGLENMPEKQIESNSFDILVANPPYSVAAFKSHLQVKNNSFELLSKISNNGSEIEVLFVERIAQLLKPNGIAAVILPVTLLAKDSGSYVGAREHILKNFYIRAIVQLGNKTFGATGNNTVIMFLEKYSEPPKRRDLVVDSVTAIMHGEELTEWEDQTIYNGYLVQIGVSDEEYQGFISESIDIEGYSKIEYFKVYVDLFVDLTEIKKLVRSKTFKRLDEQKQKEELNRRFHLFTKSIEKEKIFYFALTYRQNTIIITAPSGNTKQKEFLGYDWSTRKGAEGIQIVSPGGKMYCEVNRKAENTLAHLVRQTYTGIIPSIGEDFKEYASVVRTCDMLNFARASFNKAIKTTITLFNALESQYPLISLSDKERFSISIGKRVLGTETDENGEIPVFSANVREPFGMINKLLFSDFDIASVLWGIDGDWMVRYMPEDCKFYPTDHCGVLRVKTPKINPYYAAMAMDIVGQQYGFSRTNRASIDRIEEVKLPIPPIPIQNQVAVACKTIDAEFSSSRMTIDEYREKIKEIFIELQIITNII